MSGHSSNDVQGSVAGGRGPEPEAARANPEPVRLDLTGDATSEQTIPSIDLTQESRFTGGGGLTAPRQGAPYDPAEDREMVRRRLAYALLLILGVTIASAFITFWLVLIAEDAANQQATIDLWLELMAVVFGPLIGLVGAVTGFYYGASEAAARRVG